MSITGEPDGEPTKAGVALVDVLTGKDATIGVLAALADRARTGRGCRVEVNLLSSLLGSLVNQAQGYLETGRPPGRMGNRHPSIAPYETLRCRDGLLAVACGNDGQFARLAATLGEPGLAADDRFATNAARVAHREELGRALEERRAHDDSAAWQERLTAAGVPAGRVGTVADGFALAERLGLDPTVVPADGGTPMPRHPVSYSAPLVVPAQAPPTLGADDQAVRAGLSAPAPAPRPPPGTRSPGPVAHLSPSAQRTPYPNPSPTRHPKGRRCPPCPPRPAAPRPIRSTSSP